MINKKWLVPLALMTLFAAILFPVISTGYSIMKQADADFAAQQYVAAAEHYQHAARLLPWRGDLWEKAGISAFASENFSDAIVMLSRPAELSEQGWVALGNSHINAGDLPSALDAYQQGLQFHDSPSMYAGLAFVYRAHKNWAAERDALANQLRLDEKDAYAHYRLGLLLIVLEPNQALSELMLASSLNLEVDSAVQTLRAALALSSTQLDPSQKMVTIGRALGLVQEWELSFTAFENAVELDPENAEAWAWLGEVKQQLGRDGRTELDRALSLNRTSANIRALRGLYWNRQEKHSQALAEYLLAAEYDPQNPAWQAGIGDAYTRLGDLVAALAAYQRAVELAPADAAYWSLLAAFCAENGVYVEEIGLPAAQQAVALAPNDPRPLDALGFSYFSSGRYANAEKTLIQALDLDPDYFPAHIHLAMNYLAQGNRIEAFELLTHVQASDAGGLYSSLAGQLLKTYFP
jgi:tetratricopeptide (TPR) repeat protein